MENELRKLVHVPSRIGRDLQRYDHLGRRQVVGCIPYRLVNNLSSPIEVLMVSSQKGEAMLFPKGGWEKDESMQEAALRECLEEAGVIGTIQSKLGQWTYKSKNQDTLHDGYMFPLLVEEELEYWPEKDFRQRKWVKVSEAKKLCPHKWMQEALETLVKRLAPCFQQAESISKNSDKSLNYSQLRRAKTEMSSWKNTSSYLQGYRLHRCSTLHQLNTSTCETTVLSENFSIDSTLPSCYLLPVMVEQK
ncbi:nudix hydrolase 18, mitochondrial-like [Silene latifolia]|uniref:nudix hydrolase 18, mitochondrial-like n=1 Tax=Silene latifolia TaxID=37657 RepID=UPI003D770330